MMNFVLKMMDFVLKIMDFVLKMMDFVLKLMESVGVGRATSDLLYMFGSIPMLKKNLSLKRVRTDLLLQSSPHPWFDRDDSHILLANAYFLIQNPTFFIQSPSLLGWFSQNIVPTVLRGCVSQWHAC